MTNVVKIEMERKKSEATWSYQSESFGHGGDDSSTSKIKPAAHAMGQKCNTQEGVITILLIEKLEIVLRLRQRRF